MKNDVTDVRLTEEGEWLRVTFLEKTKWTPATFFPHMDSVVGMISSACMEKNKKRVLFDLSPIEYIDSSLTTILVQTIRLAGLDNVAVLVTNTDVANWLTLLGIDKLADIYESEAAWNERKKEIKG
jgi:ABC-type transporter Mla MlaB component